MTDILPNLTRRQRRLVLSAFVIDLLEADDDCKPVGRLGASTIKRTRKKVEDMWRELGSDARKAFRMNLDTFYLLHDILEPKLLEIFGKSDCPEQITNGEISTKLRLSAALRYFAGGSVWDIQLTHGLSRNSVYQSVYGVINAVNASDYFSFNEDGAEFPTHNEQREIAAGFLEKSGAGFDKIVMALDGMLIWTLQPTRKACERLKIGERMFHCYRKGKFGFLLMAGCDHKTRFRWADIRHPAACSDYLAWTASEVGHKLQDDSCDLVLEDHVIAGDNAFVENQFMATPVPGTKISELEDGYNLYLSKIII